MELSSHSRKEKKRNWKTYEERVIERLSTAFGELQELVYQACETIQIMRFETRGVKSKLELSQKVLILLLKHLISKSYRRMSLMLVLFSWLSNIQISYKTIERLYSDELVKLALANLHIIILEKKGVEIADCSADGSGYSLTITKHYASEAQR